MFDRAKLITDEGDYDIHYMQTVAYLRACRDYSSDNPPPSLIRSHYFNLETMAYFARRDWRKAHGLPDDTNYVKAFSIIEPERIWA